MRVILDACAVIAFLRNESGGELVENGSIPFWQKHKNLFAIITRE
jgi:hypothetical protein